MLLYEDNHLLALNKPVGIATMGEPAGTETMVTRAKAYLKQKHRKPGNVYLGVVSRLDKPVSGVLLFARTSKAAGRLSKQFKARATKKIYWAIAEASSSLPTSGRLTSWIRKNESKRRMETCPETASDAQLSELQYHVVGRSRGRLWLEIELMTGRKHQIRVQLAESGCPIVGDRKYGSTQSFRQGIALHSRQLSLLHPVRREPIEILADTPQAWPPFPSEMNSL